MSILEMIAKRSKLDPAEFSLPDLLAEQALMRLPKQDRTFIADLVVNQLVMRLLGEDPGEAQGYIDVLLAHGISVERIVNDILAPSAERLGELWVDDNLTFTEVTNAMGNLLTVTRETTGNLQPRYTTSAGAPSMLLARTPGEEHFYGLLVMGYKLRSEGILTQIDFSGDMVEIGRLAEETSVDAIGLSIAGEVQESSLRRTIAYLRKVTPNTFILVGGYAVTQDPGLADRVGADLGITNSRNVADLLKSRFQKEMN